MRSAETAGREVRVILNGNPHEVEPGATVAALLSGMNMEPSRVAVEINENIVPRKDFPEITIRNGDRIEIVTFVGGG